MTSKLIIGISESQHKKLNEASENISKKILKFKAEKWAMKIVMVIKINRKNKTI